jgi:hypothetical protein
MARSTKHDKELLQLEYDWDKAVFFAMLAAAIALEVASFAILSILAGLTAIVYFFRILYDHNRLKKLYAGTLITKSEDTKKQASKFFWSFISGVSLGVIIVGLTEFAKLKASTVDANSMLVLAAVFAVIYGISEGIRSTNEK